MKNLLIIDANAIIHRSFHALPPLTGPDGQSTGALYGLANTLLKILRDQTPDFIAAAFDRPEPTFRKIAFKEYKAHRPPAAAELIEQIIAAHRLFQNFSIPAFECAGYEGDDIIGLMVKLFRQEQNLKITILTGDLDTLQLVENDKIVVQILGKKISEIKVYNEAAVMERYCLRPDQLPDYKALVGDSSDNIPGIQGIGPKTASQLLNQYQILENIFEKANATDKAAAKILPFKEQARLAKELATINTEVPLNISLNDLAYAGLPAEKLIVYFKELGFQSLVNRLAKTD